MTFHSVQHSLLLLAHCGLYRGKDTPEMSESAALQTCGTHSYKLLRLSDILQLSALAPPISMQVSGFIVLQRVRLFKKAYLL